LAFASSSSSSASSSSSSYTSTGLALSDTSNLLPSIRADRNLNSSAAVASEFKSLSASIGVLESQAQTNLKAPRKRRADIGQQHYHLSRAQRNQLRRIFTILPQPTVEQRIDIANVAVVTRWFCDVTQTTQNPTLALCVQWLPNSINNRFN
jgi:hypothetical protein